MKVSSDGVKAGIYALVAAGVIFGAFNIYRKMKQTGQSLSEIGSVIDSSVSDFTNSLKSTTTNIGDSISGFVDAVSGDTPYPSTINGPVLLRVDQYDASTKALIDYKNTTLGRKQGDYSGYQVFSDGTIIDTYGNYLQMDYTTSATESADGFAYREIWTNPRYAFGQITPMSANLIEESKRLGL